MTAAERVPAIARPSGPIVDSRSPFVRLRELLGDAAARQAGDQPGGRRAAAPGARVRRPGARRPYRRVRPLSDEQGHRRHSARGRRTGSAGASRCRARSIRRPKCWCSTARARACSSPRSRPRAGSAAAPARPAMLIPNPFYAAYAAGAVAADCEPVYLPATAATGFLPDLDALPDELLRAHGRVLSRLARQSAGRGRRPRPISRGSSHSRAASAS